MRSSPVENALSLLVSGDPDGALRWSAAALESDAASPVALVVTARALWRVGHERAAVDGYTAAARRAAFIGDAPLAIAAIAELRAAGVDAGKLTADVAAILCRETVESARGDEPAWRGSLQPVSPLLTRRALVSRATQLVYEAGGAGHPRSTTTAFLGALSPATFGALVSAFEAILVPAGFRAVEEDREVPDLYVIASGEVEISRRGRRPEAHALARLESGAMFGEMSLLAALPSATSAVTTRPTILLVASRASIEAIADLHRHLRLELGAHCRRQALGNLGSACAFMTTVPLQERAALVDRMVSRLYGPGERVVRDGEEAAGLHLILSGEVALVGREGNERVVLSTQGTGDVVGEAELVFCRRADTEAIAVCPTATLFLPRDEFFALALDYPAILHGLYSAAVRRLGETGEALESRTAAVVEADVELDDPSIPARGRLVSSPPPLVSSPPPLSSAPPSHVDNPEPATSAVSAPAPSLAPVAVSSPPSPASRPSSASRPSLIRFSAQGAAVVAVAASVAAVLGTRGERPSVLSLPQTTSFAAGAGSPPTSTPVAAASPMNAATKDAHPAATSSVVPPAPALPSTKTFLTSSLKKRRPPAVAAPAASAEEEAPPAQTAPPPPVASAPPALAIATPHPAASAAPSAQPVEPRGEVEFGGRE